MTDVIDPVERLADVIWMNLAADEATHYGGGNLLKINRTQLRSAVVLAMDETAAEAAGMVWVKREVLEPFAAEAGNWAAMWTDDWVPRLDATSLCAACGEDSEIDKARFTVGDLRAIASLLSARPLLLTGPEQATQYARRVATIIDAAEGKDSSRG